MDPLHPATRNAATGGVAFDECGPSFDGTLLVAKVGLTLRPHARKDLRAIVERACDAAVDYERIEAMLLSIAGAMNRGDLALAAIMSGRLPLPTPSPRVGREGLTAAAVAKASPDDPDHPGYLGSIARRQRGAVPPQGWCRGGRIHAQS